jgi:hypothetical protein
LKHTHFGQETEQALRLTDGIQLAGNNSTGLGTLGSASFTVTQLQGRLRGQPRLEIVLILEVGTKKIVLG